MRTTYYFEGKKTTKKAMIELLGDADWLKAMTNESKEVFKRDPWVQNSYFVGRGMLTIEFTI